MPNTFSLIAKKIIPTDGTTSVSFSSIPSTYTDLHLIMSARTSYSSVYGPLVITFNGSSSSYTDVYVDGSPANSASARTGKESGQSQFGYINVAGDTATANVFGIASIYVPNYQGSTAKSISYEFNTENNAQNSLVGYGAGLWTGTAAITSITIGGQGGTSFISGSEFYLYGIKNS